MPIRRARDTAYPSLFGGRLPGNAHGRDEPHGRDRQNGGKGQETVTHRKPANPQILRD